MERKTQINLPGLDEELLNAVEERISEFEREHEPDLLTRGSGWIPKVTKQDYAIAVLINGAIIIWLILALI